LCRNASESRSFEDSPPISIDDIESVERVE
jgi:hypothetical protein